MRRSRASWEANRRRMTGLVSKWRSSGESAAGFARRHGISISRFQYWRDRVKAQHGAGQPTDAAVSFAPVTLVGTTSATPELEVVLPGGVTVRAGRDVRVELLRATIAALRERC
jgi:hypothetical protein